MTITLHPSDAMLTSYAAGALSQPFAIVVASHAELCPQCALTLRQMNELGAALAADAPAADYDTDTFDRILSRLPPAPAPRRQQVPRAGTPRALARLIGGELDALNWQRVKRGVELRKFKFAVPDGTHVLRLLRANPGIRIPEHNHPGSELTLVLKGQLRDGSDLLLPGDAVERDAADTHIPVAAGDEPCICIIAEEGAPRFSSALVAGFTKWRDI